MARWDQEDQSWRVGHAADFRTSAVFTAFGWMRFATREAAEQHIALNDIPDFPLSRGVFAKGAA